MRNEDIFRQRGVMTQQTGTNKDNTVFVTATNLVTPLGFTTGENFANLEKGLTGVKQHINPAISPIPFAAAMFEKDVFAADGTYTRFEQLLIAAIAGILQQSGLQAGDDKTILVISSTKGNIGLLETQAHTEKMKQRIALHTSAAMMRSHFGFKHQPIVVSSACISGVSALLTASRLIRSGVYHNVIVAGADIVSRFVVTGFQSFQALSPDLCRPFDKDRSGINLGEGAAAVALSRTGRYADDVIVAGGAVSDDANHISGPSRTGDELGTAVKSAMREAGLQAKDIGMISAHGTATLYNDEMEASAINFAGLGHAPLNSLKGYYGHTLGAAGLIESIVAIQGMRSGVIIPTLGFENAGTMPVNVCSSLIHKPIDHALKTASGFGGCNAAIIFSKMQGVE